MNIENSRNESYNFKPELQQLFDAMKAGQTIKSITCMGGSMNKDNPEKDFKIENFKATDYWVACGWSHDSGNVDLVDTDAVEDRPEKKGDFKSFYMNWVREFTLN